MSKVWREREKLLFLLVISFQQLNNTTFFRFKNMKIQDSSSLWIYRSGNERWKNTISCSKKIYSTFIFTLLFTIHQHFPDIDFSDILRKHQMNVTSKHVCYVFLYLEFKYKDDKKAVENPTISFSSLWWQEFPFHSMGSLWFIHVI